MPKSVEQSKYPVTEHTKEGKQIFKDLKKSILSWNYTWVIRVKCREKNQNTLNKQLYNDTIHQNNTLHIGFCVFYFYLILFLKTIKVMLCNKHNGSAKLKKTNCCTLFKLYKYNFAKSALMTLKLIPGCFCKACSACSLGSCIKTETSMLIYEINLFIYILYDIIIRYNQMVKMAFINIKNNK